LSVHNYSPFDLNLNLILIGEQQKNLSNIFPNIKVERINQVPHSFRPASDRFVFISAVVHTGGTFPGVYH